MKKVRQPLASGFMPPLETADISPAVVETKVVAAPPVPELSLMPEPVVVEVEDKAVAPKADKAERVEEKKAPVKEAVAKKAPTKKKAPAKPSEG